MLNIKGLLLGNFRVFSDTSCFRLAPITILTGPNSSGKSTITGSLSLMKNLDTCSLPYRVRLDSGKNPFGSFDMISSGRSKERYITAGYDLYNIILGENVRVVFTFEKGRNFDAVVRNISIRYNGGNLFDFTFDQNRIQTRVGLNYLYGKLIEIRKEKDHFQEMENNFRQIRSSSGTYKEGHADEENQVRIFHVDNELKRKNLAEYLNNNDIPASEYERLFYFYGKHRLIPGNDGSEAELTKKASRIVNDFSDEEILFNNELLIKILGIPVETLDSKSIREMISREFPDLFDCLVLLNNPDALNNIVELLRRKEYAEWEKDYLEIEVGSSRRMKGIESAGELSSAVDHHLQSRFDKSRFFRAVTELSMTREGFIQSYHRYKNVRALSAFSSLVLEKIIHDLQKDLDISVNLRLRDLNPVMSVEFDHPMHELIRNYSMMKGKDNNFLKTWFRKLNICDDLLIDTSVRGMGYYPGLMKNDEKNSLASEGSGTGRLLMMLLGIANAKQYCDLRDYNEEVQYYPGTIILEQPESGLHPSWQSKLADMFADAGKEFGLHFVVETHSEYIINKLQYLVATGRLSKDDVVIYYLDNRSQDGTPRPVEITMDQSGNLSQDIPGGFLDEEDCRSLGLFRLKRVSRN